MIMHDIEVNRFPPADSGFAAHGMERIKRERLEYVVAYAMHLPAPIMVAHLADEQIDRPVRRVGEKVKRILCADGLPGDGAECFAAHVNPR